MSDRPQRRLAAIVAADVAGYSRLVGRDEEGALAALRAHRKELIDPLLAEHGGRIANTAGDSLLLEFPSIVDAVRCSIALQQGMTERNREVDEDKRISFRVGIHLGDVIAEGQDLLGDGVNVAARLESLSAPGGVVLSDDAYRQVRDRIDVVWRDDGEHEVKNIARPVQVWRWVPADATAVQPRPPDAGTALLLPDKPSIAVLPFDNMSGDPEQEYFADGMTEDLITDLSKISGMFVVARNSVFTYKGTPVKVQQVGRELGVRYVLEGSVRKAGSRVRINVQLINALTGGHLWAERYDGSVENVFELQDEVGAKVVSALAVRISGDERERLQHVHTQNLDAYELYVRAKATPYPPLPERIKAAREMFEQVIEMDPDFAGGYAGVSSMLVFSAIFGHFDSGEIALKAVELARKAIDLDDTFGLSFTALGLALLLQGRHDEALAAADDAVARQPNDADAHAFRGLTLAVSGQPDLAVASIDQAIRLNPQFVSSPYLNFRGLAKFMAEDYEGAIAAYEENLDRHGPSAAPVMSWVAAAHWAIGRKQEAEQVVKQVADRFPDFRLKNWNFLKLPRQPEDRQRMHDLMRNAGLPE